MLTQGRGAIVNTASIAGLVGGFGTAYSAAKHGVVGLTKVAALAYATRGIRVNAVCPGVVDAPMVPRVIARMPEFEKMAIAAEPMGRLGRPEEIAAAEVWLSSDACRARQATLPLPRVEPPPCWPDTRRRRSRRAAAPWPRGRPVGAAAVSPVNTGAVLGALSNPRTLLGRRLASNAACVPNRAGKGLGALTDAAPEAARLESCMATANASFLFASPPATFRYLLQDALIVLGLPYGPQAREELARALPDLFGRSRVTLRGYQRWLARNAAVDTLERFADFMERRYQRWLSASALSKRS